MTSHVYTSLCSWSCRGYNAAMDFEHSARSKDFLERTRRFMREHVEPVEATYWGEIAGRRNAGDWRRWEVHPLLPELQARARAAGPWKLFLPDPRPGPGLPPPAARPAPGAHG